MKKKFGVLATPPNRGIYKGLKGRYQMYNTGEIVSYDTLEEAREYASACNSNHNGWTYLGFVIEENGFDEIASMSSLFN